MSCGAWAETAAYCHCRDCRKCTGSAFNVSVAFAIDGFRVGSGRVGAYTKQADSGHSLTRHFCLTCGSPLYTSSPTHPDRVYVKAGILDDPAIVRPAAQSWTRSRVEWATIDPALPAYAKGRP
ncbi:MAG: GFA family protein [Reyranellaceae bacterium]